MNRYAMLVRRSKEAWLVLAGAGVIGLFVLRYLLIEHEGWVRGLSPGCFFKRITGLNCAGCGGTRAFFAFLKGDFGMSWRMNPMFMIGLAVAGLFFIKFSWNALDGGGSRHLAWLRISAKTGWFLFGVFMSFWILRNLPWWPFILLAPH